MNAHAPAPTGSLGEPAVVNAPGDPITFGKVIDFPDAETSVVGNAPLVEINLNAYQDGKLVSEGWYRITATMGLYSPVWQSGAAHCVARLGWFDKHNRFTVMDTTEFDVAA